MADDFKTLAEKADQQRRDILTSQVDEGLAALERALASKPAVADSPESRLDELLVAEGLNKVFVTEDSDPALSDQLSNQVRGSAELGELDSLKNQVVDNSTRTAFSRLKEEVSQMAAQIPAAPVEKAVEIQNQLTPKLDQLQAMSQGKFQPVNTIVDTISEGARRTAEYGQVRDIMVAGEHALDVVAGGADFDVTLSDSYAKAFARRYAQPIPQIVPDFADSAAISSSGVVKQVVERHTYLPDLIKDSVSASDPTMRELITATTAPAMGSAVRSTLIKQLGGLEKTLGQTWLMEDLQGKSGSLETVALLTETLGPAAVSRLASYSQQQLELWVSSVKAENPSVAERLNKISKNRKDGVALLLQKALDVPESLISQKEVQAEINKLSPAPMIQLLRQRDPLDGVILDTSEKLLTAAIASRPDSVFAQNVSASLGLSDHRMLPLVGAVPTEVMLPLDEWEQVEQILSTGEIEDPALKQVLAEKVVDPVTGEASYLAPISAQLFKSEKRDPQTGVLIEQQRQLLTGERDIQLSPTPEGAVYTYADKYYHDRDWSDASPEELKQAEINAAWLELISRGYSVDQIMAQLKETRGLETPVFSPVDTIVDVFLGGLAIKTGIRAIIKSKIKDGTKAAVKEAAKKVGSSVVFGTVAGSAMSVASAMDSGITIELLAGVLGSAGVAGFLQLSRTGMSMFLQKLYRGRVTNIKYYREIVKAAKAHDTPLGKLIQEIDAGLKGAEEITPEVVAQSFNRELGREILGNLPEAQKELGFRKMWSAMVSHLEGPETEMQQKTKQYLQTVLKVDDNGIMLHDFDVSPGVWDRGKAGAGFGRRLISGFFASPKRWLGDKIPEIVDESAFALTQKKALQKHVAHAWREIERPLSIFDRKRVMTILETMNEEGDLWKVVEGGFKTKTGRFIKASPRVIDSVMAGHHIYNTMWLFANRASNKHLRTLGFQLLDDKSMVRVTDATVGEVAANGKVFTKAMKERGWKKATIFNLKANQDESVMFISPKQAANRIKDIPDDHATLGWHEAFAPIRYKGNYRVVEFAKTADGKFQTRFVAAANTKHDAEAAMEQLAANADTTQKVGYLAVRSKFRTEDIKRKIAGGKQRIYNAGKDPLAKDGRRYIQLLKSAEVSDTLQHMTPQELDNFAKALDEMGLDTMAMAGLLEETKLFSVYSRAFAKKRGDSRLMDAKDLSKTAPMVRGSKAIGRYISEVTDFATLSALRTELQKKFVATYGEFLDDPADWSSNIRIFGRIGSELDPKIAHEAWMVQKQLKSLSNIKSQADEILDAWKDGVADRMLDSNSKIGQAFGNILDNAGSFQGMNNFLKGFTATSKFGLWAFDQFIVQASGALNTVGAAGMSSPLDLAETTRIFSKYVYGKFASRAKGIPIDDETKFIMKMFDDSGYLTTINYDALSDLTNMRFFGRPVKTGTFAFNAGESVNRGMAFAYALEKAMKMARTGKGKFKVTDIGSMEFLKDVSTQADNLAHNMSKINQPMYSKGWVGIGGQFLQFATHQAGLMFGTQKGVTARERLGIWAAWVGGMGLSGVPFAADIATFGEDILAQRVALGEYTIAPGDPSVVGLIQGKLPKEIAELAVDYLGKKSGDAKLWQSYIRKGIFQGVASRAGLMSFLNSYYDGIDVVDLAGPAGQVWYQVFTGGAEGIMDIYDVIRGGIPDKEAAQRLQRAAEKIVQPFSGPRNILRVTRAMGTHDIVTSTGRVVAKDVSLAEALNYAMGLAPPEVSEMWEKYTLQRRRREAWTGWSKTIFKQMDRAWTSGNKQYMMEIFADAMQQVAEINPRYQRWFMLESMRFARKKRGLSLEEQQMLDSVELMDMFGQKLRSPWED